MNIILVDGRDEYIDMLITDLLQRELCVKDMMFLSTTVQLLVNVTIMFCFYKVEDKAK